jgi:hypothetical protein
VLNELTNRGIENQSLGNLHLLIRIHAREPALARLAAFGSGILNLLLRSICKVSRVVVGHVVSACIECGFRFVFEIGVTRNVSRSSCNNTIESRPPGAAYMSP